MITILSYIIIQKRSAQMGFQIQLKQVAIHIVSAERRGRHGWTFSNYACCTNVLIKFGQKLNFTKIDVVNVSVG